MTPSEFVAVMKLVAYDGSIKTCMSVLAPPPEERPSPRWAALSQWFNQLPDVDRDRVREVVEMAAHICVFQWFAVLDGVVQINAPGTRGTLELRHTREGQSEILNPPLGEMLHDLFHDLVPPD